MNNIIDLIIARLSQFGTIPLCNGISERAMHIGDFCFPLCYRCMFFIFVFLITLFIFYKYKMNIPLVIGVVCLIPLMIDGGIQTFFGVLSTNIRRSLTGGLFGFGMGSLVSYVFEYIDTSV